MNEFIEKFISGYKKLASDTRRRSQLYNKLISENTFIMIHPMLLTEVDKQFLVSVSDDNTQVWPFSAEIEPQREVFEFVENSNKFYEFVICKSEEDFNKITETVYIETSRFSKIELTVPTWDDLINAPKLRDGNFDELREAFEKFFNVDEDYSYDSSVDLYSAFHNDKKPSELEIREVWYDVDSYQKYGNITRLVFWKEQFIGWISYSGRWIDDTNYYVVNSDAWKELMNVMYKISGYQKVQGIRGVTMIDMSTENVESCTSVPGFTEPDYQ